MGQLSNAKTVIRSVTASIVILFCSFTASQAQIIEFDNLTLEDGLSVSVVTSIEQDSKGLLWATTENGLHRYNGKSFTIFKHEPKDPTSISSNYSTALLNDPDEAIMWVGTTSGFNKLNLKTEKFTSYLPIEDDSTSLSDKWVTDLVTGPGDRIWVATENGLNLFDPETEEFKRIKPNSNKWQNGHFNITDIEQKGNELWIASLAGILVYDIKTDTLKKPKQEILQRSVQALYNDGSTNKIWIGTNNGDVLAVNNDNAITNLFNDSDGLINRPILDLNKDKEGNLWVGTDEGLNIFDPSRELLLNTIKGTLKGPNKIAGSNITNIFIDQSSVVWLATYGSGLSKTNTLNEQFTHYTKRPKGLNSNQIRSITEGNEGNIYLGTQNLGIEVFNPKQNTFSHHPHDEYDPNSPSSNTIRDLYVDSNNYLWVASVGVGLDRYNLDNWNKKTFTPEDGLANDNVRFITEGAGGYLWFGTFGAGLSRFNPETNTFKTIAHEPGNPNSLSNNDVNTIHIQSPDSIWIGTNDGLSLYNSNTGDFKLFKHDPSDSTSLAGGHILDVHRGPENKIWVATYGGGVDRFNVDRQTFTHLREDDGLASNSTYNFLEDDQGNIWVSTNNGISRIDPSTNKIRNFTTSNGLQSREFNNGAYYQTDEGIMYFGGINGFNRFDPSKIKRGDNPPEVSITEFALFNNPVPIGEMENGRTVLDKSISYKSDLNLTYQDYVFSFEFSALNYAFPEENKYSYKMEGLEKKWNDVGNRNYVSYTNMPAGDYTFKVKAASYNGVWSKDPATVKIHIAPPFWKTTWFYLVSLVVILASIYGIYRYRVRAIRKRNQKLADKVDERTEELNEKNKDLESTLQELEDTKDELVQKARKAGMADIATGVLHNVGNILNSINTSSSIMEQTLRNSKVEGLQKANNMLRDNMNNIGEFISENPKGKKLLTYYLKIEDLLLEEQQTMLKHNFRLNEKIHLINDVISTQQSYAGTNNYSETIRLEKMIDNALTLQAGSIEKHNITMEKDINNVPEVEGQRTQVVHILVNLIKNAKEAMEKDNNNLEDKIAISLRQENSTAILKISDTGCGISEEELDKIFTHGFTTKEDGHGFGLHSCSNYMNEMGGNMMVKSEGQGKGATFTLEFPIPKTNGVSEEE